MSFTHVVTFKWSDGGFDSGGIATALRTLVSGFDGVVSYRCGPDAGLTPDAYDFAVVATFKDRQSYVAYRDDPEHRRIIDEMILPNLAVRTLVQLED